MAPEDNPADEQQPTREEYEAYENERLIDRKHDDATAWPALHDDSDIEE